MEDSFYLPWIEAFEKRKKWIFPLLILILVLLVFGVRSCRGAQGGRIESLLQGFQSEKELFNPEHQEAAWTNLYALTEKFPETEGEYDALLVQSALLFDHNLLPMAKRTEKRVGEDRSATIALLIHEKKWEEAQLLLKSGSSSDSLFAQALHLMRLGFVEKNLNNVAEAKKSYVALAILLKKGGDETALFRSSLEGVGQNFLVWLEKEISSLAN